MWLKFKSTTMKSLRSPGSYTNLVRWSQSSAAKSERPQQSLDLVADAPEFPVLKILPYGTAKREKRIVLKAETISPRYKRLSENHNWSNVWPNARNFHPLTVPLPVHMSYEKDGKLRAPQSKFNNPELLKIPNFLHLTPVTVKRHCDALKRFCTRWPVALRSDQDCDHHFPLNVQTRDQIFSGPSLRWPKARTVEITLKLADLELDEHARDKMKRLLDYRYNPETDLVSIRTDSCPLRRQNYDYGQYLLTALYFESWKTEPWEAEKQYSDWERYFWSADASPSKRSLLAYFKRLNRAETEVLADESTKSYAEAVCRLYDQGKETQETLDDYKKSVLKLLF